MTDRVASINEYTLYRKGRNAVQSWKLLNCGKGSPDCTQWLQSSSRLESKMKDGEYRYSCDDTTNLPSTLFRLELLSMGVINN